MSPAATIVIAVLTVGSMVVVHRIGESGAAAEAQPVVVPAPRDAAV